MKPTVQSNKVVVFSGSGVSAESGLPTFRDSNGLWKAYSWEQVSSPQGWERNPEAVLAFYNERRADTWRAGPNTAHEAIASLEAAYEVVVITQNVDELHERAGSTKVIHVHGQIAYARGTSEARRRYRIDGAPILMGQSCEDGTQLRPDVVWFGEDVEHLEQAKAHIASAGRSWWSAHLFPSFRSPRWSRPREAERRRCWSLWTSRSPHTATSTLGAKPPT